MDSNSPLVWTLVACNTCDTTIGGRGAADPGLKNFMANSVFRASASRSKILTDKKYFNNVKIFRATLFFRASQSCSKILNDKKYIFNRVNSGQTLFFRASSKLLKNPEW